MSYIFWVIASLITICAFLLIFLPLLKKESEVETRPKFALIIWPSLLVILTSLSIFVYTQIGTTKYLETKEKLKISKGSSVEDIVSRFEAHLVSEPTDIKAWELIAPTYMDLGAYDKAFNAYAQAIKLGNSSGENWLGLGQANLLASKGVFGPMSKVAFGKAVEKMPEDATSHYFYAATLHDAGDSEEAKQLVEAFIKGSKLDEAKLKPLKEILKNIEKKKDD